MKSYYALGVPQQSGEQLCAALTQSFATIGYPDCAFSEALLPDIGVTAIQYLQTPIEPAENVTTIYFRLQCDHDTDELLAKTLLNEHFISNVAAGLERSNLFALEILVTALVARDITIAYIRSANAPRALMRVASKSAKGKASWIERVLGTPSLNELLQDYADNLIAKGLTSRAS